MNTRSTLLVMMLLTLGLVGAAARAQPQASPYTDSRTISDTPACKRAVELAGLLKKGDEKAYIAYVQDHFAANFRDMVPMREHAAVFNEMVDGSRGSLEIHGVRTYDPPRPDSVCVLVLRNTLVDSWQAILVEVEEEAPHKVAGFALNPARPPSDAPRGQRLNPEQVAAELNALVDRLAAADLFSGTVLLAKDGKMLMSRAVGLANRDFNAPNTLDTKFNLGSMNKMMTGVAVMQLVEQGKVSLDDPIGKYLDETWCSKEVREKVKVKHLLTHTSGLGSYFNDTFMSGSRARFRTVDDYKVLVRDETLAFEPGTQWAYSNTGMLLAGAVIEKAAGVEYTEYVRRHITGPAGMTGTDCYDLDRVNANLAVGYQRRRTDAGVEYVNNIFMHVIRGGPAGGGYSTAPDLLRFDQALRSGKLLSAASMEQLWSPHPEVTSPDYGYGFGLDTTPAGKVVGHSGGFDGISSNLSMYLDEGYTVVAMSNYGGAAQLVDTKARELITQGR
jgi:CubicO group peptidase (beta-lactamase class C family)